MPTKKQDPRSIEVRARESREQRLKDLWARDRLAPALQGYQARLKKLRVAGIRNPEIAGFDHLTEVFRESFSEVSRQIQAARKTGIRETNAIKRSAGTNFQGLCEFAILTWLQTTDLPIFVQANSPRGMRDELTIHGVDTGGQFSVEPDIDICLWKDDDDEETPILFISAKTSLVDRAGQAARWKLYLDMHQTTCNHITEVPDCPIRRTKVKIKTKRPIIHCIVTANIYKIDTTHPQGELENKQCRNNTYMFKHKYTTRNDEREKRPVGWDGFSKFPELVVATFCR